MDKKNPKQPDAERIGFENPVKAAGFSQPSNVMLVDPLLTDGAYRTFLLLESFASDPSLSAPTIEQLAHVQNCTERSILDHLAVLEKSGYISRQERPGGQRTILIEDISQSLRHQELAEKYLRLISGEG